jgi:hypothetical protein
MTGRQVFWVAASLLAAACGVDDASTNESEQASVSTNGVSLNGVSLNGVSLNGVSLNGVSMNGVSVNGVSVNGVSVNGVSVNGVSVNGVSVNGTTLTGTGANGEPITASSIGATMTATLSNGGTLLLRIDSAATLPAPNTDVWTYGVSYSTDAGWMPLCADPTIRAMQIAGAWNLDGSFAASSTSFTFACRGSSVAKCVEMGYNPARGYTAQMTSCVRLLRGDYCGTGVPYTVTGHQVNIFDGLDIQTDTETAWMAEAEWDAGGARCISQARFTRFEDNGLVPPCIADGTLPATLGCGTKGFRSGAVLISEIPQSMPTESTTTTTTKSLKTSTSLRSF